MLISCRNLLNFIRNLDRRDYVSHVGIIPARTLGEFATAKLLLGIISHSPQGTVVLNKQSVRRACRDLRHSIGNLDGENLSSHGIAVIIDGIIIARLADSELPVGIVAHAPQGTVPP